MTEKEFEFDGTSYRLVLQRLNSNILHKTMLFKLVYQYGEQKELLSQMLRKIISTDTNHGIDAGIVEYIENIREVQKANDSITTRMLAEALNNYLEKTRKTTL